MLPDPLAPARFVGAFLWAKREQRAMVWVLVVIATATSHLPLGSFANRDACVKAAQEAVSITPTPVVPGIPRPPTIQDHVVLHAYCVPVEKVIGQ